MKEGKNPELGLQFGEGWDCTCEVLIRRTFRRSKCCYWDEKERTKTGPDKSHKAYALISTLPYIPHVGLSRGDISLIQKWKFLLVTCCKNQDIRFTYLVAHGVGFGAAILAECDDSFGIDGLRPRG